MVNGGPSTADGGRVSANPSMLNGSGIRLSMGIKSGWPPILAGGGGEKRLEYPSDGGKEV